MSHDVYGSNLPTFAEFYGPITVPIALMLFVLAGLSWGTLRKPRTARGYDALIWFLTGLGITIFFAMYSQQKLGVDEYFFGSIGVAWLVVLTGIWINLSRLRRQRGSSAIMESLILVGCVCTLIALFLPTTRHAREAARRTQCRNYLKHIGLALHNYHDNWNSLPPQ